jgi:hypothetical protein
VKRRLYICVLILVIPCCWVSVSGQGKYHFFYGKVQNKLTEGAISNVNLTFEGLATGSVTDRKGEFSVYLDTLPVIMVLSHIGYETKKVFLDNTSFSLLIEMVPEIRELKEVEVKGNSREAEPIFKGNAFSVLDYEPDSGNIYILVSRFRTNDVVLLLRSWYGDTIASKTLTEINPKKLFRDCLGNIHVMTSDSVYQIFHQREKLHLIYAVQLKKFKSLLADCVLSTPELLFYKKPIEHDLGMSFFTINRTTRERQTISSVKDSSKLQMAKKNPGDWNLLLRKRIPEGKEDFVAWSYVHKILYRPMSSCLFRIANSICMLNISEQTIEFYQPNGTYSSKLLINIKSINEGKWSGILYIDELTLKVYTTFFKNGEYTLYRLNLNTGNLVMLVPIKKLFPDKILIHNGFAYYLYREEGSGTNVDLFRQRL